MTTLALYSPFVSEGGFGRKIRRSFVMLAAAFIAARNNRAMMLVSFYSTK